MLGMTHDGFATGYIPRDYASHPSGCYAAAPSAPDDWLVPPSEQEGRLAEQKARKASLWDLREANYDALKSLNQGQHPLCWAFSSTKSAMYLEAIMGTPTVLSAFWTAGISNGWRDQGGWGASSTDGLAKVGGVPASACPDFRSSYDNAANRALAAKRKVIEWYDGSEDRSKNTQIMISAFLLGLSPVLDYSWLGHSMAGCYIESINPLVVYADNSWGAIEQYGPKGLYKLTGSHAIPDGIVVPRFIQPVD